MAKFTCINGRVLHFLFRPGNGHLPIVFANSLGTDFRIWDEVIERLPEDATTLQYDKSGHGLSEEGAVTISDHAADLAALMDTLGLAQALVCGVSVGGMIALELSLARPDLTVGLFLSNTGYKIGTYEMWNDRIKAVNELGLEAMADDLLERWFSGNFWQNETVQIAGYRMMLSRTPAQGYASICAAIRDVELSNKIVSINCRTFCLAGSEDKATSPEVVAALADKIPGAMYHTIEGVGHIPAIEAPDTVAQHIREQMALLV